MMEGALCMWIRGNMVQTIGPVVDDGLVDRITHKSVALIVHYWAHGTIDWKIVEVEGTTELKLDINSLIEIPYLIVYPSKKSCVLEGEDRQRNRYPEQYYWYKKQLVQSRGNIHPHCG